MTRKMSSRKASRNIMIWDVFGIPNLEAFRVRRVAKYKAWVFREKASQMRSKTVPEYSKVEARDRMILRFVVFLPKVRNTCFGGISLVFPNRRKRPRNGKRQQAGPTRLAQFIPRCHLLTAAGYQFIPRYDLLTGPLGQK